MNFHRISLALGFAVGSALFAQNALAQTVEQGGAPPTDEAVTPQPGEHVDHSQNVPHNPKGPHVVINVDLTAQNMHVQFPDGSTADWPVSSGRPGLDTPSGHFTAQWVDPDHLSKQYQDAPMPYAVFFDLKGHAFHGSYQKRFGVAVSHGCVRLPVEDAKRLFEAVKVSGADVDITGKATGNAMALRQEDKREFAEAAQGNANGYGYGGSSPFGAFHSADPNQQQPGYPPYPGQNSGSGGPQGFFEGLFGGRQ
jgi:lipoprotein-anchoring transpeptidase ErfK/SrfK